MTRRRRIVLFTLLVVAACGEETPTDVGGSLLPEQAVRTFEAILDPATYLVYDTAFSGYAPTSIAAYMILASAFEGVLNARGLARFEIPASISVTDSAGTLRTDTMPGYFAGRLVVRLDTVRSTARPTQLRVFQATEDWHALSATWALRVDSGGVRQPWAVPGGSPGIMIDSASWLAGDSVVLRVDSQTIAMWRDTANFFNGVVIEAATNGARLRTTEVLLQVDARTTIRRDTVVTTTVRPPDGVFIFDPPVAEASSSPRAGGLPAWRTYMQVIDRLDTLSFPCPGGPEGCRVRLADASITYAALLLEPQRSPPGFSPEDSVQLGTRLLLVDPVVPLKRSPLGAGLGVMPRAVPPARFRDPGSNPIEVPVTDFLRAMVEDSTPDVERPLPYLSVIPVVEGSAFGFASFAPAPRLRLILTVFTELQLR